MITLLHPSRGRADKAHETFVNWMQKSSGKIAIQHILSLDEDDAQYEKYIQNFQGVENSIQLKNHNTCVVDACNKAAKYTNGDVMIYLSDDFKCPDNWDTRVWEKFFVKEGVMIDTPLLIKVDDCLQGFEVDVLTIPIMNKALYWKLGYFWHPGYKSMFVDQDLYWVCRNNNYLMFCRDLKFPHEHYSNGKSHKDETYMRSDSNWNSGKAFYAQRKAEGFKL